MSLIQQALDGEDISMKRFFTGLIALAAIVAFLASFSPVKSASADDAVASVELHASGLKFDQSSLTVPAYSTVQIVLHNDDYLVAHDITVDIPGADRAKCTGACDTVLTFNTLDPGYYHFKCTLHDSMVGDLIVQ
jgi:plastocyanin